MKHIFHVTNPPKRWWALLCFWVVAVPLSWGSGKYLKFDHYDLEDGLSQGSIGYIYQDHLGFMWFCTQDGLNRFDGYQFKAYHREAFNTHSLSSCWANMVLEGQDNTMWVLTNDGIINRYDRDLDQFTRFAPDANNPGKPNLPAAGLMMEDGRGQIWLASEISVLVDRFNPKTGTFISRTLAAEPGNPTPQGVSSMCVDGAGRPWFGTLGGGVFSYDYDTDSFRHYLPEEGGPERLSVVASKPLDLFNTNLNHGMIAREGIIWFLTEDGALNRLDPMTGERNAYLPGVEDMGQWLMADSKGSIWIIYRESSLLRFDPSAEAFTTYQHDPDEPYSIAKPPLTSLLEDSTGTLWITSNGGGICRYDREKNRFLRTQNNPQDKLSLSSDYIHTSLEDRGGNIWFGGMLSVEKFSPDRQKFRHHLRDLGGSLGSNAVWDMVEDAEGHLWVGTEDDGLIKLDLERVNIIDRFKHDPGKPDSLPGKRVRGLHIDEDGNIWMGTTGSLVRKGAALVRANPVTREITAFPEAVNVLQVKPSRQDNNLLNIAALQSGLFQVNRATSEIVKLIDTPDWSPTDVSDFEENLDGSFWISGLKHFHFFNPITGEKRSYHHDPNDKTSLSSLFILDLLMDSRGHLWICTSGGGFNQYRAETDDFTHYTLADGLPNDVVYSAQEDESGMLWLATNNGLSRFDPRTRTFRNFGARDGLQSNEFSLGAFYKSKSGELMFGGPHGFNTFYSYEVSPSSFNPPMTMWARKGAGEWLGRELKDGQQLFLKPDDNVVEFGYAALDFAEPEHNSYAYKLEGFNEDWVTGDKLRRATYTNLDRGNYQFRSKAVNRDGVWSNEKTVELVVLPHFWETRWFLGLMVLATFLLVYLVVLWQRKRQEAGLRERELERKSEELEYARHIQLAMLPKYNVTPENLEVIGQMVTATEVGGDYYDFFQLDDRRLLIAYGDATGHGVAAGLVVGMVKMAATIWSLHPKRLVDMMNDLNEGLKRSLPVRSMGMGLGLALFDLETHQVELCAAGMPFPYHYRAREERLETLVLKGPPLGFVSHIEPGTQTIELEKDDLLIFLSDGLMERFDHQDRIWGESALRHTLTEICAETQDSQEISERLLAACNAFAGDRPNDDDMTIVIARVKEASRSFSGSGRPFHMEAALDPTAPRL